MRVGDYVRTKYGIKQIYEIDNNKTVWKYKFKLKKQDGDGCIDLGCFSDSDVIKSSANIIDLIEVGDVIKLEWNGVEYICDVCEYMGNANRLVVYCEDTIIPVKTTDESVELKSIVTKEQFSQMEYRIGE